MWRQSWDRLLALGLAATESWQVAGYMANMFGATGLVLTYVETIEQQRWQIDRQSYYVGRRNYDDLTARSTKDYSSEMFTGRIYPSRP